MAAPLSLTKIKKLTGVAFVDGSTVVSRYSFEPLCSVDEGEARSEKPQHKDMKLTAQTYFEAKGWRTTQTHIGLNGYEAIYRFADFAMERGGKLVLVECLPHWRGTKKEILKKLQLEPYATLWFIIQPRSRRTLSAKNYKFISLRPTEVEHYGRNRKLLLAWKPIKVRKRASNPVH